MLFKASWMFLSVVLLSHSCTKEFWDYDYIEVGYTRNSTHVYIDSIITNGIYSYSIDCDTISEFKLYFQSQRYFGGDVDEFEAIITPLNNFEIIVNPDGVIVDSTGYNLDDKTTFPVQTTRFDYYPELLYEGYKVDEAGPWGSNLEYYLFYKEQVSRLPDFPYFRPVSYLPKDWGESIYIGFRMIQEENTIYGWIEFQGIYNRDFSLPDLKLVQYAYRN